MEGWQSGLMRRTRNAVGEKSPHRFKSCTLRFARDESHPPRPSNLSSELVELSHLALATTKAMILSAPYLRSVRAASLIVAPLV